MKITQIRNATILIETQGQGILVDPMFAPKGAIPSLKYATRSRQRNPRVDLPANIDELKQRITCCLITHCQKGHFDHLDRAATKWLRENKIPVYCSTEDQEFLSKKGLQVLTLDPASVNEFFGGTIELVRCTHGIGFIGSMMAHGHGYFIQLPDEPSLYLVGDTILTAEVENFITMRQPDNVLIPAGGAQFDLGGEIIMGLSEAIEVGKIATGQVIANHLESLDHCPVTRESLVYEVNKQGWSSRFFVPDDGASLTL